MNESQTVSDPPPSVELFHRLQTRADILLQELSDFESHLKSHRKEREVEIRVFKRGVESEAKGLRNIGNHLFSDVECNSPPNNDQDEASPHLHVLKSSNLPFYESVWKVAKSCNAITALSKKFYPKQDDSPNVDPLPNQTVQGRAASSVRRAAKGVLVDIVADNGLEWIKVSTISEKRLLFEIAKEGWESYADIEDEGDDDLSGRPIDGTDKSSRQLELVRLARELQVASHGARVNFKHPRVRFVLPKIQEGLTQDVDAFVADLRATGAAVDCGYNPDCEDRGQHLSLPIQFSCPDQMLPSSFPFERTGAVNLDCTILLAIISDISHLKQNQMSPTAHALNGTYHSAIMRQIKSEEVEPMLPNEIYPMLSGNILHCTSHAAQRMREIVRCMGTMSERTRADIILGEGEYTNSSKYELGQLLGDQSNHAVPSDLQFPVKVVDFEPQDLRHFPSLSRQESNPYSSSVAIRSARMMNLTPINSSVFLYGWMHHMMTLTSNRAVVLGLLKAINMVLDQDERKIVIESEQQEGFDGPQIYICQAARSLIGKAKTKHED